MSSGASRLIADPLVLLAPGRCFSSVICAMLGQHPQMYGLLETQLFVRDNLSEWWEDFGSTVHSHGLLRAVAEINFGEQSPPAIKRARRWLWTRRDSSTAEVFCELAEQVYPLILIDKTPMVTYRREHMERIRQNFPGAKFIHLIRHPAGYGRSLLKFFYDRAPLRQPNRTAALLRNPESIFFGLVDENCDGGSFDPQNAWFIRQSTVIAFTSTLPENQHIVVRGEDILADPSKHLRAISEWLGLRSDAQAIQRMMQPENSVFASAGPWNARLGADPGFLEDPVLRPFAEDDYDLDRPVPWSEDGAGFCDRVKILAREFGYR